ncbi:hypothetical protein ACGE0T_14375 [Parabacteroides sp. APC149_11_2_Y6]
MKEKISSKLKELVGKNNLLNLSERTITGYADLISGTVTEETELTDDFYSKHLEFLKTMNGQIYADTNSKVEEFKKTFKPEQEKQQAATSHFNAVEEPQWAKDLREKYSSIESKLTAKEKAELRQANLDKAKSILKGNGATNEKVLNIALKLTDFDEQMTPEQIAEKGKSVYDSTYKDLYGEGAAPASSSSSTTEKPISQEERAKAIEENQKKYRNQIV